MTRLHSDPECADLRSRAPSDRGNEESGFVLVGVVMFVLALTILGLSLFSLSGYEAQFLSASYRRTQLFYDAMSAMDRTKYVLATSGQLEAAGANLPLPLLPSIVMAEAEQNGQTTGPVIWTDPTKPIQIRVRAEQPGIPSENVELEAQFIPQPDRSLYHDLIATTGEIFVYQNDAAYEHHNIYASGKIRNPDVTDWAGKIHGAPQHVGSGAPVPEVQDFFTVWQPNSVGSPTISGPTLTFGAPSDAYRIFDGLSTQVANPPPGFAFSSNHLELHVSGNSKSAVWLLPGGAYFEQPVEVTGSSSNNLIIVASKSTNTTFHTDKGYTGADIGLWFEGGIHSNNGPNLFLISDGTVALDRWRGTSHDNNVILFLSILSGGVYLRGPKGGPGDQEGDPDYIRTFELSHPSSDDVILDPLYDAGILPNTLGRSKNFSLVPGSFQEITNSAAPN